MVERCYFCDEPECLENHHIVPRRHGGSDRLENLVTVCPTCHRKLEKLYGRRFYERLGIPDNTPPKDSRLNLARRYLDELVTSDSSAPNISTQNAYLYYRRWAEGTDTPILSQQKFTMLAKTHPKDFGYEKSVRTPSDDYPVRGFKRYRPQTV